MIIGIICLILFFVVIPLLTVNPKELEWLPKTKGEFDKWADTIEMIRGL